MTSMSYRDYSE